jgi:hypothetical protein
VTQIIQKLCGLGGGAQFSSKTTTSSNVRKIRQGGVGETEKKIKTRVKEEIIIDKDGEK